MTQDPAGRAPCRSRALSVYIATCAVQSMAIGPAPSKGISTASEDRKGLMLRLSFAGNARTQAYALIEGRKVPGRC